jgi:hypothetical protein
MAPLSTAKSRPFGGGGGGYYGGHVNNFTSETKVGGGAGSSFLYFGTQLSSLDKQSRKYTLDENVSDFSIIQTYATCRPSANAHELTCEPITGTYVKDTRRAEEPIVRYGDGVALIEVLPVPVD